MYSAVSSAVLHVMDVCLALTDCSLKIAQVVIDESKDGYPELEEKKGFHLQGSFKEEEKFNKTIDQGLRSLQIWKSI